MDSDNINNVVFDCGSRYFRGGLAGEQLPNSIFRSVVGRPKYPPFMTCQKDCYIGEDSFVRCGILKLTFPAESHPIPLSNWSDLFLLYHHGFYNQVRVAPEQSRLLLSDRSPTNCTERQHKAQHLFESLQLTALHFEDENFLSLMTTGKGDGCVVDVGHKTTRVGLWKDYKRVGAVATVPIGGYHVTERLQKLLNESGYCFTTTSEREILDDVKQKHGCFPQFRKNYMSKDYELPDGTVFGVQQPASEAPQVIFQPALADTQAPGLHELIQQSYSNIAHTTTPVVLSGGGSCLDGIEGRLWSELYKAGFDLTIIASPSRKDLSWIGGSILASLSVMNDKWITKAMYDQIGVSVINRQQPLKELSEHL